MLACLHACMPTSFTCLHPLHACRCACIHVCMHTCLHAYMLTCIHACMHTCLHAFMHTCLHALNRTPSRAEPSRAEPGRVHKSVPAKNLSSPAGLTYGRSPYFYTWPIYAQQGNWPKRAGIQAQAQAQILTRCIPIALVSLGAPSA